jgi:DNA repair protein RadC
MENQNFATLKTWAEDDRPREKLFKQGRQVLTDSELLAILIRTGTKSKTAVDVAKEILFENKNDLNEVAKLSVAQLCKFPGMGPVKAITIVAALELGRRKKEKESTKRKGINTSKDGYDEVFPFLADLVHEEFVVLMLNRANEVVKKLKLSKGGVGGTVVDQKIIFKEAIENLASGIILAHNHPSGNLKPSKEDLSITKKLKLAGEMLEIKVLDHIIVAGNDYFSFADEGLL